MSNTKNIQIKMKEAWFAAGQAVDELDIKKLVRNAMILKYYNKQIVDQMQTKLPVIEIND